MSLDVVYGESRNRPVAVQLADQLQNVVSSGTIYLGYPVLASADDRVEIDALMTSSDYGLVAFLIADTLPQSEVEWADLIDAQDRLYNVLESNLGRHETLRSRRRLAFDINTATIFGAPIQAPQDADGFFGDLGQLEDWLDSRNGIDDSVLTALQAALQRVTTIKPAKTRNSVKDENSRGSKLKTIEKQIANLDRWQKRAAIETPEGPQRIRGLAGSGKTVVLALKAAYLHSLNPDWNIALTFHSRALYQQMDDLVTRFTFEHSNDLPDPQKLRIIHSWGSPSRLGVYSTMARALGVPARDYNYARTTYGIDNAFQGVLQELLAVAKQSKPKPIFDAVLIDEAQDLPSEFFQLVYIFTKDPKRIVWGYDELQKLSEVAMPDTDELFGRGPDGESLVTLDNRDNEARRDIVLPICYRNTPWALATAHALGIGVYRAGGLLQHPDDPQLWAEIGYSVTQGNLELGSTVTLERAGTSYPSYFPDLLRPNDAVVLHSFKDELEQDEWVARQIKNNLTVDELEHDDILIVLPDTYRAKSRAPRLISTLRRHKIDAHLVGVGTSRDEIFMPGSVAIAHIYRAKGNEAPMVYAVDSQHAASQFNAVTRRNTLFTAITRSRAWVRITGHGPNMDSIAHEVATVQEEHFRLHFAIPTGAQLAQMRHIYRDRTREEEANVKRATEGLEAFIEAFEREEIDLNDLPPALRARLRSRLREELNGDDH